MAHIFKLPDGAKVNVRAKKFKNWLMGLLLFLKHTKGRKPHPKPIPVYMYDDVNPSLIPPDAKAVAGYIGGQWPTYEKTLSEFPKAKHLSIAVSAAFDADVLDVEPGDATIAQAAAWVRRQKQLRKTGKRYNTRIPILYTAASWGQNLIDACSAAGLKYGVDYLWWSAHYMIPPKEHFCGPSCGFNLKEKAHATQFTDKAEGRSLDESICSPSFFD